MQAAKAARAIFGSFRRSDTDDPEVYHAACKRIFMAYPEDAVIGLADPLTGIAGMQVFLPAPAELKAELDRRMAPILAAEEREREREETRRMLEKPLAVATPEERERAVKKYFDEIRPEIAPLETSGSPAYVNAREALGMTQAQWDAIPNRPRP